MRTWIGVDFDGTLAMHSVSATELGQPIPLMVERVRRWLAEGRDVRIFTSRAAYIDNSEWSAELQIGLIQAWCVEHLGVALPVTATKTMDMSEFWDDRAVQVIPNTGLPVMDQVPLKPDNEIPLATPGV